MADYIDGYAFPIPRDSLQEYQRLATAIAAIWKEHGAIDYTEYVSDEVNLEPTRTFRQVLDATENETVVFGWMTFDSRETRDHAHEKVASDPRVAELMSTSKAGFDASRMAYDGFRPLVT